MLFLAGLVHAQTTTPSTTENYVYTKTYLSDPTLANPKTAETVQYFDGLGRPKQVVNVKASPLGKDVVTHIEYDGFGRQAKDFLPIPQSSTQNGAIFPTPLSNASAIYGGEKIYAEKIIENSPLDRIQQQIQVGTDWANKPVKLNYDANTVADRVRKFTTSTIWENGATKSTLGENWLYTDAQLYKNSVKDEDGNETIEFKNGQGQLILLRKVIANDEYADTYYVYNEYNQLAYVIPPLASIRGDIVSNTTQHDELCYIYRYDGRNRLVEKKVPGKGWEQMIYNKRGQIVYSRDINLKNGIANFVADEAWVFTKYDKFGRPVYTGICRDGTPRQTIQQAVDNQAVDYETRGGSLSMNGMTIEYGNTSYPTYLDKILSVNYYDTYPTGSPAIPAQVLGQDVLPQDTSNSPVSTKSLPTASYVKNIEDDNWTKNYSYYDTRGRVVGTYSINHLGGFTETKSELDFAGATKQNITRHKRLNSDTERVITETFEYDHQNRLLVHKHKIDNNTEEILAQNKYNELSQLESKKVGGTIATPLQIVDYTYNIRGWMTKINDPANLNGKLFGYEMKYTNPIDITGQARYNGNITEIDWSTQTDNTLRRFNYYYDVLNRFNFAQYSKPNSSVIQTNSYNEWATYDLNGNIKTMGRYGLQDTTQPLLMDQLQYTYLGNRLNTVNDISQNPSGYPLGGNPISYDDNGNMINHLDKGINQINYNFLNLPSSITTGAGRNSQTSSYGYRADGVKINKILLNQGVELNKIDYLDGFQYKTAISQTTLNFIPTSEGYFNFENNKYIYNYTDHLGNIRLSYFNNGFGAEIIEENNYYAFGLKHEGYNALAGNPAYNYKYNGKELQQESGMYDYGARFYMPDLGMFGTHDPLSELQFEYSPYAYVNGNPIRFYDPTGMIGEDPDPKKIYGPKGGHPIEEVVMTYTRPSPLSFMGISNMNAFHASQDRYAMAIRGSKAALATEKFEKNLAFAMGTFGTGGSNLLASAGWATLDTYMSYQDEKTQGAVGKVQLMALFIQVRHGNISAAEHLLDDAAKQGDNITQALSSVLSEGDVLRIENAATRINKPITVVGSRASGTAGAYSDWDYVIEGGLNSKEWSKIKNSIPGAKSAMDNTPRNIDIFTGSVNRSKPHIIINPRK